MARASDLGAPAAPPVLGRQNQEAARQPLGPRTHGKSGRREVQQAAAQMRPRREREKERVRNISSNLESPVGSHLAL